MTTAKHTPGPWRSTEAGTNFAKGKRFIRDTYGLLIAVVPAGRPMVERYANADLIAAAPALADALEAALEDAFRHDEDTGLLPWAKQAQAALRAAGRLP